MSVLVWVWDAHAASAGAPEDQGGGVRGSPRSFYKQEEPRALPDCFCIMQLAGTETKTMGTRH